MRKIYILLRTLPCIRLSVNSALGHPWAQEVFSTRDKSRVDEKVCGFWNQTHTHACETSRLSLNLLQLFS